jgi:UTP--glucose-1-phosphate uridylyltransferase
VTVHKAVIPAAGLGTRFLPASKVLPKEMIPVIDRPGIQWAVEECSRDGVRDICIVTSRGKELLADHFDIAPELEASLSERGKTEELEHVRRVAELAQIYYVRQLEPLGLGHAVLQAEGFTGGDPFVVLLPDEIVPEPLGDEPSLMQRMVEIHEEYGQSVVAVREVAREDVSSYGIVSPEPLEDDVARILNFVEKPAVDEAPSNLASVGRYILTPTVMQALATTAPGHGGEIQLTDAIQAAIEEEGAMAYIHRGPIFDVGRKLDHLKASIQLALRRNDLAGPLKEFLSSLDLSPGA